MHHLDGNGAGILARAATLILAVLLTLGPERALATATVVRVFNLQSAKPYDVLRNGTSIATVASSDAASISFVANLVSGDVVAIGQNGNLQPPPPPVFATLSSPNPGCAHASWLPSGDPTVVGYAVSYGRQSVSGGQAAQYETTLDAGAASTLDVCLLSTGTYYFAVRARDYAGLMSAYSSERAVQIVVVAVLISAFDARVVDEGVALSWRVESDEVVREFRVYRTATDAKTVPVAVGLPADATAFVDRTASPGTSYTYMVAAVKENGDEVLSFPATVSVPARVLALGQNAPNPFNPSTTIPFTLDEASRVVIRVYDVLGARVATVLDTELAAGGHTAAWNGVGEDGARVASGTYFYTLTRGERSLSRKMVVLK